MVSELSRELELFLDWIANQGVDVDEIESAVLPLRAKVRQYSRAAASPIGDETPQPTCEHGEVLPHWIAGSYPAGTWPTNRSWCPCPVGDVQPPQTAWEINNETRGDVISDCGG